MQNLLFVSCRWSVLVDLVDRLDVPISWNWPVAVTKHELAFGQAVVAIFRSNQDLVLWARNQIRPDNFIVVHALKPHSLVAYVVGQKVVNLVLYVEPEHIFAPFARALLTVCLHDRLVDEQAFLWCKVEGNEAHHLLLLVVALRRHLLVIVLLLHLVELVLF